MRNRRSPHQLGEANGFFLLLLGTILLFASACQLTSFPDFQGSETEMLAASPSANQTETDPPFGSAATPTPPIPTLVSSTSPNIETQENKAEILSSRKFDIKQTIELTNDGPGDSSRIVIWVAMIQTIEPYQRVTRTRISPEEYKTVKDEHGNLYAEIEFTDVPVGETRIVELSYELTAHRIRFDIQECGSETVNEYLHAETFIESDSIRIVEAASLLKQDVSDLCEAARDIYDYVGDEIYYSQYSAKDLGALAALEKGEGDCTEFSDLFIALSRASGIPARFLEGVTCCTENGYQAGENKHDWAEVYLPGTGWVPVDPTWGRHPNKRELYFASMTPDHIIVTQGRNLETLGGYHYYYYRYFWEDQSTNVSSTETWSILGSEQ